MTALTNRQSTVTHAYLTAWNKYEKVKAIQAGANVDEAAWDRSHDAAGDVASAFGVKNIVPMEALLDLLCSAETPPCDVASVAAVVREIVASNKSSKSWTQWCERHPETRAAEEWLKAIRDAA